MERMFDSNTGFEEQNYDFQNIDFSKSSSWCTLCAQILGKTMQKLIFPLHPGLPSPSGPSTISKAILLFGQAALTRIQSPYMHTKYMWTVSDPIGPAMRRVAFRTGQEGKAG